MAGGSSGSDEQSPLLRSAREIIRLALVTLYRVPVVDAANLESELLVWFDRLRRRAGAATTAATLRGQLVSMACRVAHIYWTGKLGEAGSGDRRVERTLALGPEVVATELEARLSEKESGGKAEP
jgi:hypothetical protein